jgi:pimeloyl-ACP methyl ester carboxylesterase
LGGETTRSLNAALALSAYPKRVAAGIRDPAKLRAVIAQALNVSPRSGVPPVSRENSKLLIEAEPGLHIAADLSGTTPPRPSPAIIYINPAGRSSDPDAVRKLVADGNIVLAVDPRGWGESAPPPQTRGYSNEWQMAQRAMLIGKPLPGMQTFDVLRAFDYLASLPEVDPKRISVTGVGVGGPVALFAAALEPRIASVATQGAIESYMAIVQADTHKTPPSLLIPGVLRRFDLVDVKRAITPRPVIAR